MSDQSSNESSHDSLPGESGASPQRVKRPLYTPSSLSNNTGSSSYPLFSISNLFSAALIVGSAFAAWRFRGRLQSRISEMNVSNERAAQAKRAKLMQDWRRLRMDRVHRPNPPPSHPDMWSSFESFEHYMNQQAAQRATSIHAQQQHQKFDFDTYKQSINRSSSTSSSDEVDHDRNDMESNRIHAAADQWAAKKVDFGKIKYRMPNEAQPEQQFRDEFASKFSAAEKMAREKWKVNMDHTSSSVRDSSSSSSSSASASSYDPSESVPHWMSSAEQQARQLLNLSVLQPLSLDRIKSAFQQRVMTDHPDNAHTGSTEAFHHLKQAQQLLMQALNEEQTSPRSYGSGYQYASRNGVDWEKQTKTVRP